MCLVALLVLGIIVAVWYIRRDKRVSLYKYHGAPVIVVADPGFDTYTTVYSMAGRQLGVLGGISGAGDGRLPDWYGSNGAALIW